jgi:hypothetical protein
MSTLISAIDTIYETIIEMVVRSIRAYTEADTTVHVEEHVPEVRPVALGSVPQNTPSHTFKTVHTILQTPAQQSNSIPIEIGECAIETISENSPMPTVAKEKVLEASLPVTNSLHHTVMYAGAATVPLYPHPTVEFDTQITTIPYGETVLMCEPSGRFFKVIWNTYTGWVLREDLVDRAAYVYPQFVIGEANSVDDTNTARVRTIIKDTFGLNRSEFALQAGEYVLYTLWRKGISIAWPETRPRVPGLWHKILKGVAGVRIGVTPKTGSLMEYVFSGEVGHVAYVEAVFPDDTITISEVNYPDSGIYNERVLVKEEWKDLKPVFISVQ